MRQLSVINTMDAKSGGPAQAIRYLFPYFNSYNCIPEVVCLDNEYNEKIQAEGLSIISLGDKKGIWQYSKKLYPWLINNIENYDYIIIHGLWIYHSFAVTRAISILRKDSTKKIPKVYVMCHGMLDPWFQKSRTRIFKAIRNWFYWKLIEHKVIQNANGILFTCEEEMRLASTTFTPYRPKNVYNVGYGIQNPPEFVQTMMKSFYELCPKVKGKKYLLFLSRIHPKKGLDLLVNAYSTLVKDQTLRNRLPQLVIAGPGFESKYGLSIKKMVASYHNLNGVVHFTDMLSGDAKWGSLYGCEAFILPSHQENFGIAVVEAMACSKPVLISNQVNIWKEIKQGGAGLVGDDNLEGVINIIKTWVSFSDDWRLKMETNAFNVYKDQFTVDKVAKNIFSVLTTNNV